MDLAPVVIFTYNRLEHIKSTIISLSENKIASESTLFVYSDGPKHNEDFNKIEKNCAYDSKKIFRIGAFEIFFVHSHYACYQAFSH